MLQRTKIADTARLSVVSPAEFQPEPQPNAPEAKAEAPQARAAEAPPSAKTKIAGALKANRKRVLMGVALALLAGAGWYGFNYVTSGAGEER